MQVQRSYAGFELAVDTDQATLRHAGQLVRSWPTAAVGSLSTSAARALAQDRSDRLLVLGWSLITWVGFGFCWPIVAALYLYFVACEYLPGTGKRIGNFIFRAD